MSVPIFWENITHKTTVIRTSPPWKSGTKARGVTVWCLIIAGHLQETLHRQNITECRPLTLLILQFCDQKIKIVFLSRDISSVGTMGT